MSDDIAEIVRAAEVLGLQGENLDEFILEHGSSLEAYREHMRWNTLRAIAVILALVGAIAGVVVWWFWNRWIVVFGG